IARFDHLDMGAVLLCQRPHPIEDLMLTPRCRYLECVSLEPCGILHVATALCDECDDLAVEPVDVGSDLGQGGAEGNVGGIGEAPQRRLVDQWLLAHCNTPPAAYRTPGRPARSRCLRGRRPALDGEQRLLAS